jgi:hypothetical protein
MAFRKKFTLFFCLLCVFLLNANFVSALEITYPDFLGKSLNNNSTLADFVCYLFNAGLALSLSLVALVIVFGGVYYLISYGRGKYTSEAKDWIKAGILGFLIIGCSSLIIYTINPEMNKCKILFLPSLNSIFSDGTNSNIPRGAIAATYNEIPIGNLTESLLTRTTLCWQYDQYGDPFGTGNFSTTGEPVQQDRISCLKQAFEGAEKKAQVIATLSKEIAKLMDSCSCRVKDAQGKDTDQSKCEPVCNPLTGGCKVTQCPGGACEGNCINGLCQKKPDTPDCCPAGVLDKIEHGPIQVHLEDCPGNQCVVPLTGAVITGPIDICVSNGMSMAMVQQSINEWNALTPHPVFGNIYTQGQPGCSGAKGTVGKYNWESRGLTSPLEGGSDINSYSAGGESITGFSILLRDALSDPQATLTHEFGHALGLGEAYLNIGGQLMPNPDCKQSVMNHGYMSSPGSSDKEAIDLLYSGKVYGGNTAYDTTKEYKGLDELRCDNGQCDYESILNLLGGKAGEVLVSDPTKWAQLTLWQQLKFEQGMIEKFPERTGVQVDIDNLKTAKTQLNKCYLAIPSVDFVGANNVFSQADRVVIKAPTKIINWENEKPIDTSKYCTGFGYSNSSCLLKCNNMCPATGGISGSRPCPYGDGPSTFNECISTCQDDCVNTCKTLFAKCSGENTFCQAQCKNNAACVLNNSAACLLDTQGTANATACIEKNTDDKGNLNYCVSNAFSCQSGSSQFSGYKDCVDPATQTTKCETFTDQKTCEITHQNDCLWMYLPTSESPQGGTCIKNTSASFLYQYPNNQKCTNAYTQATSGPCKSSNPNATCKDVCPETAKCPTASRCLTCPCDYVGDPPANPNSVDSNGTPQPNPNPRMFPTYSVPTISTAATKQTCGNNEDCSPDQVCVPTCPPGNNSCGTKVCMSNGKENVPCSSDSMCASSQTCDLSLNVCVTNAGKEKYTKKETTISTYQMVGPQCTGYSFNEDPLTFYCEDNWWNDPKKEKTDPAVPVGEEKTCKKQNDIPIGQTIDESISWIKDTMALIPFMDEAIQKVLDKASVMGKAKTTRPTENYCTCSAQFANSEPICKTDCKYSQKQVLVTVPARDIYGANIYNADGSQVMIQELQWQCSCDLEPCKGSPCQQVIDYHSDLWNTYKDLQNVYMNATSRIISERRSDILKKLTYSRQKTNSCSVTSTDYGAAEVRLLNCTRARDELMPPINQELTTINDKQYPGYCYGKELGDALKPPQDLTDNWYCCEQAIPETSKNQNPIYNVKNINL